MFMRRLAVSRLKTAVQIALIAVVMLMAAGTPAAARTAAGRQQHATQVTRYEQYRLTTLWRWLMKNLSRYAMAAN
jgi:hypothetical protein